MRRSASEREAELRKSRRPEVGGPMPHVAMTTPDIGTRSSRTSLDQGEARLVPRRVFLQDAATIRQACLEPCRRSGEAVKRPSHHSTPRLSRHNLNPVQQTVGRIVTQHDSRPRLLHFPTDRRIERHQPHIATTQFALRHDAAPRGPRPEASPRSRPHTRRKDRVPPRVVSRGRSGRD